MAENNLFAELPGSLWVAKSGVLRIPPEVSLAYVSCLEKHSLLESAKGDRPNPPPVGGYSQEQTDLHFAHAFDGSVARVELALLDPHDQVASTSETLRRFLTGGSLCLVDVPCGAGAAALALLGTTSSLREAGLLPRVPLNVHIIGGEISAPARAYAEILLNGLKASWAAQAIFVTQELTNWDVLSAVSNGELVEKIILRKSESPQTLVIVSNFNGFLESSNKKKDAQPQLGELFKFASGLTNAAVWIEPIMNAASKGLFPWLKTAILKWAKFANLINSADVDDTSECLFELPAKPSSTAKVRLCVLPIELVRSDA